MHAPQVRQSSIRQIKTSYVIWWVVQVAKHTKSRKTTYATIELFTLKQNSEVINDVLELPSKGDKVLQIAWEPNGHRFAVIHGELAPGQKQSVSFYTMMDKTMKQGAKLLGTVGNRYEVSLICNCFHSLQQYVQPWPYLFRTVL